MYQSLVVVFLLVAVCLVTLIILQQSAHMETSVGIGASRTLFGSSGSGNFMTRMTAVMATLFLLLSLILGNVSNHDNNHYQKYRDMNDFNRATDILTSIDTTYSQEKDQNQITNNLLK